jgi:dipeptidyl aminopeptidase/acylaminoacyl peptidase
MRRQGGEAYQVTDAKTGVSGFQWSPDGKRIAYLMKDTKSKAEKKREKQKRDVNRVNQEFRYNHLYTTQVKPADDTTRKVQRLTQGSFHVEGFDWSPDGETIGFSHRPDPAVSSYMELEISTVLADSGAIKTLVDMAGWAGEVHYSPDGKKIAFTSCGDKKIFSDLADAYVIPASGGTPRKLAHTPNRNVDIIEWTSEGKSLLVSEVSGTSYQIIKVPADGEAVSQISSGGGIYGKPILGPLPSYSSSADRLAFTYENSKMPPEVYVSSTENFNRRKITSVNQHVPTPPMGKTELISWTGPGNQKIEGLLTYPVGYDKGDRVPLVLNVHGGPITAHLSTFTGGRSLLEIYYKTQVFAQEGYAVLRPNPRGSDGYGQEFRKFVIGNWGPGPLKDLMAGVDKTIDMGVVHPDSLAIMGWSYGGYMSAYAVTQTDRFKAASMGAGLSNLMFGFTDYIVLHQMGSAYWKDMDTYEENSPIFHVDHVATPTQVLHGTKDKIVPTSQGREFYRALKRLDISTELVLYPRTPHFPREPKIEMDITTRVIDWFDKHLGRDQSSSESQ